MLKRIPASLLIRSGCVLFCLAMATACSPKSRPANFYLLQPVSAAVAVAEETSVGGNIVGVGPVDIPAYLDRPQIVTEGTGAKLRLDEFQRWAEPLRENFSRVLAENLSVLLPSSHIVLFPWNRAITPDYQVEIQIIRFQANEAGVSELKAHWNILRGNQPLLLKEFKVRKPVAGNDFTARVEALSLALGDFSQEIARELQSLNPSRRENR